jgi:stage II sporulation protein R
MTKQLLIISFILLSFFGTNLSLYGDQLKIEASQPVVIPDQAIRLRILANSDSDADQALKRKVRDNVNAEITKWVKDLTSIDEARKVIKSHIGEINKIVAITLENESNDKTYNVEFDHQVNFPTKMYGNYIYPAGKYEAILITLGAGKGANWWCVLFPPLCFLDFSNGEAVKASQVDKQSVEDKKKIDDGEEKVEVKFFIVEFVTKIFSEIFD